MKRAGRVGDVAVCEADSHGCPACAHAVVGPALTGSDDTMINDRMALRLGDCGTHSSCCGSNTWSAAEGSSGVYINDRPAHRASDGTIHCGGTGSLTEGSSDVLIGDHSLSAQDISRDSYGRGFVLYHEGTDKPAVGIRYRIRRRRGDAVEGETDEDGRTKKVMGATPELLVLDIHEEDVPRIRLREV